MGRIVGIDLGTTNSVVATLDMGGCKILPNKENEQQTRSVVGWRKGEFLIGASALRYWPMAPKDTIVSIKRLIGRAFSDPEVDKVKHEEWFQYDIMKPSDGTEDSVRVNGTEYSPVDISARILSKLKQDAEYVLGEEVSHAVITVPAYFSEKQRHATREAGLQSGLKVMKLLDEPTAAAIAFGVDTKSEEPKTILVYDLGGGTFDISVLMMAAGSFAPLNLEGDMWLGGDNFDQVIVDYVVDQVKKEYGLNPLNNKRFMVTLKMEAQKAKEALSSSRAAEIIIPGVLQDAGGNIIDVDVEITREHFERMIEPLVASTVTLVNKALEGAGFSPEDIDYVLMAGNSTAIPKVQEAMENLFGKEKISRKAHPKHSVAMGAAMTAAIYSSVNCPACDYNNNLDAEQCEKCGAALSSAERMKRCPSCGADNPPAEESCRECGSPFIEVESVKGGIAPFHYGIQTAGDTFHVFVRKGDPFETPESERQVQTFRTRFPNQRIICVPVYGGENLDAAGKNVKQGVVYAVLPPQCPEGLPIKAKLWLDKDGAFIVDTFLEDGTDLEDLFLRGEQDQKAVDLLVMAEDRWSRKRDIMAPEEKSRIEALREQAFDKMNRQDFRGAAQAAEDIAQAVDNAGTAAAGGSHQARAQNLIATITPTLSIPTAGSSARRSTD